MSTNNLKLIPKFKNEEEEAEFWSTHDTSEYFDVSKPIQINFSNLKPTTKTISLRLPVSLLQRIRNLANKKDVPYQSLMKIFLDQKSKEESLSGHQ